jgi:hypothetical protein
LNHQGTKSQRKANSGDKISAEQVSMNDVVLFFYCYLILVAWCLCGWENHEPRRHKENQE